MRPTMSVPPPIQSLGVSFRQPTVASHVADHLSTANMTQHMGFMDLSDEEDKDEEPVVGYLEVLSPASLGWQFKEFKDGVYDT